MEIGFIGLGNLGTVMVQNLIEKNHQLHLYNRTAEKMQPFASSAIVHNSIASLAQQCDVVISIVSNDKAVQDISFGKDGLIKHLKPGSVHVCLSTIAPSTASQLYEAHRQQNLDYVTATIIGRPEAAKARNLVVCYSGQTDKKETLFNLLKDLGGNKIFEFGVRAESAAVVKVCNNFLIIAAIEAMGEAFNLVQKADADQAAFYQMITDTLFQAPIYKNYGKIIIDESYDKAGFTSRLGLKDTQLALGLANELSVPLPLADLIKNRFLINHNRGRAGQDWTSIVQVIKEEN